MLILPAHGRDSTYGVGVGMTRVGGFSWCVTLHNAYNTEALTVLQRNQVQLSS